MIRVRLLIGVVLIVGYSLYGGMYLTATAVHESATEGDELPSDHRFGTNENPADRTGGFEFSAVDAGFEYSYRGDMRGSYMDALSNAGVYVVDYNRDGWPDLLAVGGARPILFENTGGEFEPSGAVPPLEREVHSAMFLDYDTDGWTDLLLLSKGAPPLLLENDAGEYRPRGVFDRSLANPYGATAADYDRDGHLDLLIYQYGDFSEGIPIGFENYSAPVNDDNGYPNLLYRGSEDGFERVDSPAIRGSRWTLAATSVDITGNGHPDVHLANDFNYDIVYANRGDGTFEQIVLPERTNRNGMSSEIGDLTGNGRPDIFVTNIYYPQWFAENNAEPLKARGNYFILNRGNGTVSILSENSATHAGGWGWAAVLADFDNDGDEDLFHTTKTLTFRSPKYTIPFSQAKLSRLREKPFYRSPAAWVRGPGASFRSVSVNDSGFERHDGRGAARLDYDRDGDLDLAVATDGEFRLYENRMERREALHLRVLGPNGSQAGAHGAVVTVNASTTQTRWVHPRTDFLSQDSRVVHVGTGNATEVDVRIEWPDGSTTTFRDVKTGQRLVVTPNGIERRHQLTR